MQVRTRMCTSLDGYISNAADLPVQLSDPEFDPEAYGFVELQANSDAVLMGHTTLMPALEVADQWPWSDVDVFVLASERPAGTPDAVVIEIGLPYWRPPRAATYVATHGAARVNLETAAEALYCWPRRGVEQSGSSPGS